MKKKILLCILVLGSVMFASCGKDEKDGIKNLQQDTSVSSVVLSDDDKSTGVDTAFSEKNTTDAGIETEVTTTTLEKPISESTRETITEPTTEAETELITEAITEAETEPITEAVTEAETESITEAVTEAETEPVTEAETEPTTEAVTEAVTEPTTEAVTEAETEPTTEAITEDVKPQVEIDGFYHCTDSENFFVRTDFEVKHTDKGLLGILCQIYRCHNV